MRLASLATVTGLLLLVACGGGGGTPVANMMPTTGPTTPVAPPQSTKPTTPTVAASQSPTGFPYTDLSVLEGRSLPGYYFVGGDAILRPDSVVGAAVGTYDGVDIAYGIDSPGVGRSALLSELLDDLREGAGYIDRWNEPPTVRVAHGTPDYLISNVRYAVQMINTALPPDWQIGFNSQPASAGSNTNASGEIFITFAPRTHWPTTWQEQTSMATLGVSWRRDFDPDGSIRTAPIWINPAHPAHLHAETGGIQMEDTLVHEILHSLGREHPVPLYGRTDTIMSYSYDSLPFVLSQLDQEILLATYSRLQPGTTSANLAFDLGPWDDTATHIFGGLAVPGHPDSLLSEDFTFFGVRMMNDRAMPWAVGPEPLTWIWDNPTLTGSASWAGMLVGFTPSARSVMGDADMSLDLADLDGTVDFTSLESWAAQPSDPGTGSMWGDGDLHYTIQVDTGYGDAFGNYRPGLNDDDGILDGGFFGPSHETVAGVLERDDLTAAFGAELQ